MIVSSSHFKEFSKSNFESRTIYMKHSVLMLQGLIYDKQTID